MDEVSYGLKEEAAPFSKDAHFEWIIEDQGVQRRVDIVNTYGLDSRTSSRSILLKAVDCLEGQVDLAQKGKIVAFILRALGHHLQAVFPHSIAARRHRLRGSLRRDYVESHLSHSSGKALGRWHR